MQLCSKCTVLFCQSALNVGDSADIRKYFAVNKTCQTYVINCTVFARKKTEFKYLS